MMLNLFYKTIQRNSRKFYLEILIKTSYITALVVSIKNKLFAIVIFT